MMDLTEGERNGEETGATNNGPTNLIFKIMLNGTEEVFEMKKQEERKFCQVNMVV